MNAHVLIVSEKPLEQLEWECRKLSIVTDTLLTSNDLKSDLKDIRLYVDGAPKVYLIGTNKGGYLLFNALHDLEIVKKATKVVIAAAPFNVLLWEHVKKLPSEEAEYYITNPAGKLYVGLPPTLLLYSKTDPHVIYDQGRMALNGLRKTHEPGASRPNVQLVALTEGSSYSPLEDVETCKNIIRWLGIGGI